MPGPGELESIQSACLSPGMKATLSWKSPAKSKKVNMKTLNYLSVVGGSLLAATAVQAQVDIYITGATAFRANAYRSIRTMYGGNLTSQNPAHDASGQNRVTFQGTIPGLYGAQTVTIRTSYSGSVEGVQSLVQNITTNEFLTSATPGIGTLATHLCDLSFSDVFQSSTIYQSQTLLPSNPAQSPVGVV